LEATQIVSGDNTQKKITDVVEIKPDNRKDNLNTELAEDAENTMQNNEPRNLRKREEKQIQKKDKKEENDS